MFKRTRPLHIQIFAVTVLLAGGIAAEDESSRRRTAEAYRLAASSREVGEARPIRSLLLAVEAVRVTTDHGEPHVTAAQAALQDALSRLSGRHLGDFAWKTKFSSDNRWMVSGTSLWDLRADDPDASKLPLAGDDTLIGMGEFSPDSRRLVWAQRDRVVLWDLASPRPRATTLAENGEIDWSLPEISGDSRWVAVACRKGGAETSLIRLWDLESDDPSHPLADLQGHGQPVSMTRFSPDSRWLTTVSRDAVRLWDFSGGGRPTVRDLSGHDEYLDAVAYSPDSRWLLTMSRKRTLLWDLAAEKTTSMDLQCVVQSDSYYYHFHRFTADSRWLVLATDDHRLRLWDLSAKSPPEARTLHTFSEELRDLEVSPDSRWLVAVGRSDTAARRWDLGASDPASSPRLLEGHRRPITDVAMDARGRWVATAGDDGAVRVWRLGGEVMASPAHVLAGDRRHVSRLVFSEDGGRLVTAGQDGRLRVWDLETPNAPVRPLVLGGHESGARIVALSADGRWLAGGRLWDLEAPDQSLSPVVLPGPEDSQVHHLLLRGDGEQLIVCGGYDRAAQLWRLKGPHPTAKTLGTFERAIQTLTISPDRRWLAMGSRLEQDGLLWDFNALEPGPKRIRGHAGVSHLQFDPSNRWLLSGGHVPGGAIAGSLRLWDLKAEDPTAAPITLEHEATLIIPQFSPDGRWLLSSGRKARLWNLQADDPSAKPIVLGEHDRGVRRHGVSGDSRWAFTIQWDTNRLRLWDLTADDPAKSAMVLGDIRGDAAFTADSRWLAARDSEKTLRLWDLRSRQSPRPTVVLPQAGFGLYAVTFSRTGRWVAATASDGKTRLWDLSRPDPASRSWLLKGHPRGVYRRVFSSDDRWLVTGGNGMSPPRLWDLSRDDPAAAPIVLPGNVGRVERFRFSDEGRWLATSDHQTLHVWDLQAERISRSPLRLGTGAPYLDPPWHLESMRFTPDSRTLICGYRGGVTRLWTLDVMQLVHLAEAQAGRTLTPQERQAHGLPPEGRPQ